MLTPNTKDIISFSTPSELHQWLSENHDKEKVLWVKIFKKKTGISSITWDELVIECLCWGWIDGIKKSFDEQSYIQRITPRKTKSIWSKRNTEHVQRLINEGRIKSSGLIQINAAKQDGRWKDAYSVTNVNVPDDFLLALDNHPQEKSFFETLPPSSKAIISHGLTSAKKTETRLRRFNHFMDMLHNKIKPK
jgi:uncharacterized protein YdeI (YjbR/CyaY-like superfamily)